MNNMREEYIEYYNSLDNIVVDACKEPYVFILNNQYLKYKKTHLFITYYQFFEFINIGQAINRAADALLGFYGENVAFDLYRNGEFLHHYELMDSMYYPLTKNTNENYILYCLNTPDDKMLEIRNMTTLSATSDVPKPAKIIFLAVAFYGYVRKEVVDSGIIDEEINIYSQSQLYLK